MRTIWLHGILNLFTLAGFYNPNFGLSVQGRAIIAVKFILELIDLDVFAIDSFNDILISMGKDADNETGVG